jgi:hypothetical protein
MSSLLLLGYGLLLGWQEVGQNAHLVTAARKMCQLDFKAATELIQKVSLWEFVDILLVIMTLTTACMVLLFEPGPVSMCIMACNCLFAFCNLFYYLRGFPSLADLISTLYQIVLDMLNFFVIVVVLIMGFSLCFFTLHAQHQSDVASGQHSLAFSTLSESLYSTYLMSLNGEYDQDLYLLSPSPLFYAAVVTILQIFVGLVMLNALIAIMSDTFDKMQESREKSKQQNRCALVVQFLRQNPDLAALIEQQSTWIHVMQKRSEGDGADGAGGDDGGGDWSGRMAVMRQIIERESRKSAADAKSLRMTVADLGLKLDGVADAVFQLSSRMAESAN